MDATTVTIHLFGSEQPLTLDLAAIYQQFQQVLNLRHRRGVRYPLAALLTIVLWAKRMRASQLRAPSDPVSTSANWLLTLTYHARQCRIRPPGVACSPRPWQPRP